MIRRSSRVAWFPVPSPQAGWAGVLLGEAPNQAVIAPMTRVLPAVVAVDMAAGTMGGAGDRAGSRQRDPILPVNRVPGELRSERSRAR